MGILRSALLGENSQSRCCGSILLLVFSLRFSPVYSNVLTVNVKERKLMELRARVFKLPHCYHGLKTVCTNCKYCFTLFCLSPSLWYRIVYSTSMGCCCLASFHVSFTVPGGATSLAEGLRKMAGCGVAINKN